MDGGLKDCWSVEVVCVYNGSFVAVFVSLGWWVVDMYCVLEKYGMIIVFWEYNGSVVDDLRINKMRVGVVMEKTEKRWGEIVVKKRV